MTHSPITAHPNSKALLTLFNQIGADVFSLTDLQAIQKRLGQAIAIGINRTSEPTTTDGGVLAAPTGAQHITMMDLEAVPADTRGITAACGGTNWFFAETVKGADGQVTIGRKFVREISEHNRQHTYASFANIIVDGIAHIAADCGLMNQDRLPVSISLGFPQITVVSPNGDVDAKLPTGTLPKFWHITDYDTALPIADQPGLGSLIKTGLQAKGINGVEQIVILNDTVAVALDVQHDDNDTQGADAPVGFVFGTGTNAAMAGSPTQGLINLEIGHAESMEPDQILETMYGHGWIPHKRPIMEYWIGGGFLLPRLKAALELLRDDLEEPDQLIAFIENSENQALVSELAAGEQRAVAKAAPTPNDFLVVQEAAGRILAQAGQLMGVFLVTVCEAAGYTSGGVHVPFEGSLMGKGYKVYDHALETATQLQPDLAIHPYHGSGMTGVNKLAMARLFAKA